MKKIIIVFILVFSMLLTSAISPVAIAETKSTNGTSYKTYTPPDMDGEVIIEENTGDFNWVPYNNDVLVPMSGGTWGRTLIADFNHDGYLDFKFTGNATGEKGSWVFYGNPDAHNPESENYMVMGERRFLSSSNWFEGVTTCTYDADGNYVSSAYAYENLVTYDVTSNNYISIDISNLYNPTYINGDKVIYGRTAENKADRISSSYHHSVIDINGDGLDDLVYSLSEWGSGPQGDLTEHGSYKYPNYGRYDGLWGDDNGDGFVNELDPDTDTNGDGKVDENDAPGGDGDDDPIHGYILYSLNTNTNQAPVYSEQPQPLQVWDYEVDAQGNKTKVEGSNLALDNYGRPSQAFWDYDGDGDLDLITSSTVGIIRYFENIGTRTEPIYIQGQRLKAPNGRDIMASMSDTDIFTVDWNQDGLMDIFMYVSADEGRGYLIENTGKLDANNMPIFTEPKSFMCPSDKIKINAHTRPVSVDWDIDGDEDLLIADSSGYISYVKNLTIEKALEVNPNLKIEDIDLSNPSWDAPVYLKTPDDKDFLVKAGYKGNPIQDSENFGGPQGPSELNLGYIQATAADWDMDGTLDIVYMDVYGRVRYLKGIAGDPYHVHYPENLTVEWANGQKVPAWYNWWTPDEGALVTIWRTTPEIVDLPIDEDGDGIAEGDGLADLILIDHEGYFAFYQRYRDRDGSLKLKEGKRIFKLNGNVWQPTSLTEDHGKLGWRMIDWDCDGDLDIMTQGTWQTGNVYFYENISEVKGEYNFVNREDVHPRAIRQHEVFMTFCDWNKDGIPDLLVSGECGNIYYLINPKSK